MAALVVFAASAHAEPKRWTPVVGKSHVSFDASFRLGDFSGHTDDVSGEFQIDTADVRQGVAGVLRVNPATLRTGVEGRDRDLRKVMEVERYPEIRFTIDHVESSFPSVTDRSDILLTIDGVMMIHGVEHRMTFPGRARVQDARLWVRGENRLKMTDFGITPPSKLFMRVADTVLVSFDVLLAAQD
jgi:polyisoprenoid-binding protein YceI